MPSKAQRVRDIIRSFGAGATVTSAQVCDALDLIRDADKQPVYNIMRDMARRGELMKVEDGTYQVVKLIALAERAPIQHRMWAILRMRRTVTAYELASLTGAEETYAREWLAVLVGKGVVRHLPMPFNQPHKYQLVVDTLEMPTTNEAKARRLHDLREKKKQALTAINAIGATVSALRQTIESLEV